ncbi:MAG: ethanolamine utilization microcompartment protein EutL [Spirochaetales bacterium]|nr:ethanolamine utilization microcompartment protein EutL [Spirochaetales bacterium]
MTLEPLYPVVLSTRIIADAHADLIAGYGGDPARHRSLGLLTCDQDDPTYVAMDEATKHAPVDIIFARSFYAGARHSSGKLSGEILAVMAGADPDIVAEGMKAAIQCLKHDACFYSANDDGSIAVFPHVIARPGSYFRAQTTLGEHDSMAYLVAPPLEATYGFEKALKAADVQQLKLFPPPTETNFAALWLKGDLPSCQAAAEAFAETVVEVGRNPLPRIV